MPVYDYRCSRCGDTQPHYRKVDEREDAPFCCGARMTRGITAPMIFVRQDIHYTSPVDDRPITSMKARLEDLARHGCRPYDPGMKEDYNRRQRDSENQLEDAIGETVDREIALMPARKREKLEAEMHGGMGVEPVRQTAPVKPLKVEIQHG